MKISVQDVERFLLEEDGQQVTDVVLLVGGKNSEVFLYLVEDREYVIRFNKTDIGFHKDQYAFKHFSQHNIPIPEIYKIGEYTEGIYFSISEKISGETVQAQYKRKDFSSLSIQLQMIERIARIPVVGQGFGKLDDKGNVQHNTFSEYIEAFIDGVFAKISNFQAPSFYDEAFSASIAKKLRTYAKYSDNIQMTLHGDFGNDNVLIQDGTITGVIDWEKLRYGDHFLDVGRIVLYCPNRKATVSAALDFYKQKQYKNYRERIAMGVYHTMLLNYILSAKENNEASCMHSPERIEVFERLIELV